eukprot:TRINITY_DN14435_c0_g1_i1.p1 TRINITY_DN14435_c0_g1~~TRINITY_DN14435_c0_g1_i1.p1  ORF type:complete len:313 (+),score=55.45 TRINITY_DN14435_c0_g1_i1:48-941(+)
MRRCSTLLAAPMHMAGYPVDAGKMGFVGPAGMYGAISHRFQNRVGDAIDWDIMSPEWYWERGGYEPMGNMPKQWKKDGFGDFLVSLKDEEIELLVIDVIHDMILEENLRDGLELRAPHPDTGEALYSKIPSWIFHKQGWSRPDVRDRILDRVWKAFRIIPPFHQRMQITHPVELVSWIQARVAFARKPETTHHDIPKAVKGFLDKHPRQPELGFLLALPDKERTPLRQAHKRWMQMAIDADYEYKPKPRGEPQKGKETMYWLELERNRGIDKRREASRNDRRQALMEARAARRVAAA